MMRETVQVSQEVCTLKTEKNPHCAVLCPSVSSGNIEVFVICRFKPLIMSVVAPGSWVNKSMTKLY